MAFSRISIACPRHLKFVANMQIDPQVCSALALRDHHRRFLQTRPVSQDSTTARVSPKSTSNWTACATTSDS